MQVITGRNGIAVARIFDSNVVVVGATPYEFDSADGALEFAVEIEARAKSGERFAPVAMGSLEQIFAWHAARVAGDLRQQTAAIRTTFTGLRLVAA